MQMYTCTSRIHLGYTNTSRIHRYIWDTSRIHSTYCASMTMEAIFSGKCHCLETALKTTCYSYLVCPACIPGGKNCWICLVALNIFLGVFWASFCIWYRAIFGIVLFTCKCCPCLVCLLWMLCKVIINGLCRWVWIWHQVCTVCTWLVLENHDYLTFLKYVNVQFELELK